MNEWYYGKTGSPQGPVDDATLRERIASGAVTADTLIWKRGMPEWQPLATFPDLLAPVAVPVEPVSPVPSIEPQEPSVSPVPPSIPAVSAVPSAPPPPPQPKTSDELFGHSPYQTPGTYNQPGYGNYIPTGTRTSGLAIASLVCGIVSFVACLLSAIPAIICGHLALREINRAPGQVEGRGMAIAGLVLGYLFTIGFIAYILIVVVAVGTTGWH